MVRLSNPNRQNFLKHLKGPLFALFALFLTFVFASQAAAVIIPGGGTINPAGTRMYVPEFSSNSMYIFDLTQDPGPRVGNIPVGGCIYGMVISPDGHYLYVSVGGKSGGGDTTWDVQVYDISGADPTAAVAHVSFGANRYPKGIAITPDGKTLYVAEDGSGSCIHVVDVSTPTSPVEVTAKKITFPANTNLYGVAVKPDGTRLYVSERTASGNIYVYNITGSTPTLVKTVSNIAYPTFLFAVTDGTASDGIKLLARVSQSSTPFYDVMIFDTANDSMTSTGISVTNGNDIDPSNSSAAESLSVSPNGEFFYVSHYQSSNGYVHTYAYVMDLSHSWEIWGTDTSKDFSVISPNGKYIYLSYSNGGSYVRHGSTGIPLSNGVPSAPRWTAPLAGQSGVTNPATWVAATDDGQLSPTLTYIIEKIEASQIGTNNWLDATYTTNLSASLASLALESSKTYYLRIRAFDGTPGNPPNWSQTNANYGPYAYTGPFTTGTIPYPPRVDWVYPDHGPVLTVVDVHGVNFGATKGASTITIGGVTAAVNTWSDTVINCVVPGSLPLGAAPIVVTVSGMISNNDVVFTVTGPLPSITSINPSKGTSLTTGPVATVVTITGSNFGATQNGSTVNFATATGTVTAAITSWSDTQIVATVPNNAVTGNVTVTTGSGTGNTYSFTVLVVPTNFAVTGIADTNATATWWAVVGADLYRVSYGTDTNATNGGTLTTTNTWQTINGLNPNTQYYVKVRAETSTGVVTYYTTPLSFSTRLPSPEVYWVYPDHGDRANLPTTVEVHGLHFGTKTGSARITIGGVNVTSTAVWNSDTLITAMVPAGLSRGPAYIQVTDSNGNVSNGNIYFTVLDGTLPVISELDPNKGYVNDRVTIRGYYFGALQGTSTVWFGATNATANVVSWSDREIVVRVPNIAVNTYAVHVTVNSNDSNSLNFQVLGTGPAARPHLETMVPTRGTSLLTGPVATQVTVTGINFGATQGGSRVWFAAANGTSVEANITSWSNTQIVMTVPNNALSGILRITTSNGVSNGLIFTVLIVPTNFTVTNIGDTYATASWYSVDGADLYRVSYGTDTNATNGGTLTTTNTWQTINGLNPTTLYYVKVRAETNTGVVTYYTTPLSFSTHLPSPEVYWVYPDHGDVSALPTTVEVHGVKFGTKTGSARITIGGVDVTGTAVWNSPTLITAIVPAGLPIGPAYIQVTDQNGMISNSNIFFTVLNGTRPVISELDPNKGYVNDRVTIRGYYFGAVIDGSTVWFNGSDVSANVVSWSDREIVIRVPGLTPGIYPVHVTVGGFSSNSLNFEILSGPGPATRPHVETMVPTKGTSLLTGPVATQLTVTGINFGAAQGNSRLWFSAANGTSIEANIVSWSDTSIVATVPNNALTGVVRVVTGNGVSNGLIFTVLVVPTNLTVTNIGDTYATASWYSVDGADLYRVSYEAVTGGTVTTVTTTNTWQTISGLTPNTQYNVQVRAETASSVVTYYTGTVTFTTSTGAVSSLLYISPDNGNRGETINVKLVGNGTHFVEGTTTVGFGAGITVNSVSVVDWTHAIANITIDPAASLGTRSVTVTTGAEIVTGVNMFTVNAAATQMLLYVVPDNGDQGQTLNIKIVGSNTAFAGSPAVSFSGTGITVNSTLAISPTEIVANISIDPAALVGPRNVTVGALTLNNGFTVNTVGTAMLLYDSPDNGDQGMTGLNVHIFGFNTAFLSGGVSALRFTGSGITVNYYTVISNTEIVANINIDPAAVVGYRSIILTSGGVNYGLINGFRVNPAGFQTLMYIVPDNGNRGDTLTVRVYGVNTNFNGTSALTFGSTGINVNSTTVLGPTTLEAVIAISGAATLGPRDVIVTTSGVALTLVNGFTVNGATTPEIISIVPSSEYQGITRNVVITGRNTNFVNGITTVAFSGAGITVNSVTVANATSLTANITIAPAAAVGPRDVIVTTGAQIASLANGFTVLGTSPMLLYVVPSSGNQGLQNLNVRLVGNNTHFVQGNTGVTFGAGITVNYVQVINTTNAVANISIDPAAALGARTVTVTTGPEIVTGTFNVIGAATPSLLYVVPDSGIQGAVNLILTVVGTNTAFANGITNITFSNAGITVNSTRVIDSTHAIVDITIAGSAATGPCDVTATTGAQVVTLQNGFTVYTSTQALAYLVPNFGYQGTTKLVIAINGINSNFAQGLTNLTFSGGGITVNRITVTNQWYATAEVDIASSATVGARNVTVQTNAESITIVNGFTVLSRNNLWIDIDPFEGTEGISHYQFGDASGAIYDRVTYHDGSQGWHAMYSYGVVHSGGWGGALPGILDISNKNCVTFWLKGDGSNNRARIEFTEPDGDVWSSSDPSVLGTGESMSDTNWHLVVIPFSQFVRNTAQSTGNGVFDKVIVKYNFVFTSTSTNLNLHYVDTIRAELRDLFPPTPVILYAHKSGANDIRLDWTASTDDIGVLGYRVYHSTSAAGPWAQLGADLPPGTLTYIHAGAQSDGSNHYYYVVAFDGSSTSQRSNIASIVKLNLTFKVSSPNRFWVSIPYYNSYTNAGSFLLDQPDVTEVSRLNPITQVWEKYNRVSGGTNFPIITGEGFEVLISRTTTLAFVGSHNPNFSFDLQNIDSHLISVPYSATYLNARAIVDSINGGPTPGTCTRIIRLNPATQLQETLAYVATIGVWTGTNFTFNPGEGYMIVVNNQTIWVPSTY